MQSIHQETNRSTDAPSIHTLIEPKYLAEVFNVSHRTIKRWAKQYKWEPVRITNKIIRYHQGDIEKSLGVSLDPSK